MTLPAWATPQNNGQVGTEHLSSLSYIGWGTGMIAREAVPTLSWLRDECLHANVMLTYTGTYRTRAQQEALWTERGGVGVARPGTSMHGWGFAIDLSENGFGDHADPIGANGLAVLQWIIAAWALPWKWDYEPDDARFEPWHINFTG